MKNIYLNIGIFCENMLVLTEKHTKLLFQTIKKYDNKIMVKFVKIINKQRIRVYLYRKPHFVRPTQKFIIYLVMEF